jgi:hypothetical protein
MDLTPTQQATLVADIAADPVLSQQPQNSDGASAVAEAYNVVATPDYWVYRTNVARREYLFGTSPGGTSFTFQGNGFITRTAQELTTWRELFHPTTDTTDPSLPTVQQALLDIFSGPGNAQQNRVHIGHMSRRLATRVERLYVTGTGTPGSPGTLHPEGPLQYQDVLDAWEATA